MQAAGAWAASVWRPAVLRHVARTSGGAAVRGAASARRQPLPASRSPVHTNAPAASHSEETLAKLAASCDEFLVHGVDVEGMQLGIDDELVRLLGAWAPIPVTYAGGARTLVGLASGAAAGAAWPGMGMGPRIGASTAGWLKSADLPPGALPAPQVRRAAVPLINISRPSAAPPQPLPSPTSCFAPHRQEDLERVRKAGGGRVDITVGSALDIFGGQLAYADVVAWHRRQQEQGAADVAAAAAAAPQRPQPPAQQQQEQQPAPQQQEQQGGGRQGEQLPDGTVLYRDPASL